MSESIINKNLVQENAHSYLHTSMVSHRGTPISFAMREDGHIYYSVLDLSNPQQRVAQANGDSENDKNFWSKVAFDDGNASCLQFPRELMQVGYSVVPNFKVEWHDANNQRIVQGYDNESNPLDTHGKKLTPQAIQEKQDSFNSSTAKLGAKAPFQTLSDGKFVYLFRQSIAADDANNETPSIVDNTLLVDRFILSGTMLKLSREVRYQRSRHKTEPESRKDTLAAVDVDGNPFYEPTRELVFANHLSSGGFAVLLIPGSNPDEQRWQIFSADSKTGKINSFNIRFDYSIIFDMSDSQMIVDAFVEKYKLDDDFTVKVQQELASHGVAPTDTERQNAMVAEMLAKSSPLAQLDQNAQAVAHDALQEVVQVVRTGVAQDDFYPTTLAEWPLIEYDGQGAIKQSNAAGEPYLNDRGVLRDEFAFLHFAKKDSLKARPVRIRAKNGLSACYYYQQEMGADGKPLKNNAYVMLAMGVEDQHDDQYIGILNFAVAASGRLARLTTDNVNLPDIDVQALDENPYRDLAAINQVTWQESQKMQLLDIDPNGLSTSGGLLKFAYTSAGVGESEGYSDAVSATAPTLFDDSLGRVNLYFKGRKNNFFVMYFNPVGSKEVELTPQGDSPPTLTLKPRLERDMTVQVGASVSEGVNTCTLAMVVETEGDQAEVERWNFLPKRYAQISAILNGNGEFSLGTLEPLGDSADPRAAYRKPASGRGSLTLRTNVENNLVFNTPSAHATDIAGGKEHILPLADLSAFLANHVIIEIGKKLFSLAGNATVRADTFHKAYLSGVVDETTDIDKLWDYLKAQNVLGQIDSEQAFLKKSAFEIDSLYSLLTDDSLNALSLLLLQEGNSADKKARLARLRQSLVELIQDVAKVRLVTFSVQDENSEAVDRLGAGLQVMASYAYADHFLCQPALLNGPSASEWEHAKSYLFNATLEYDETSDATTEITPSFSFTYTINNTVGQWEAWEASLALEMRPNGDTNGPALLTTDSDKLDSAKPSKKGLSIEAWIKPADDLTHDGTILFYNKDNQHYSLGITRQDDNHYKARATFGDKQYVTRQAFAVQDGWRHIAFTHKQYWGYSLDAAAMINCGNDSSLQLDGDFSLELLVRIDSPGTLLKKEGMYHLYVDNNWNVIFDWGGQNMLVGWNKMGGVSTRQQKRDTANFKQDNGIWYSKTTPHALNSHGKLVKLTIIRSRSKPRSDASGLVNPLAGSFDTPQGDGTQNGDSKWYEDKDTDEIIMGMAKQQDELSKKMSFSQTDLFGDGVLSAKESADYNPTYFHSLIVSGGDSQTWTTPMAVEIDEATSFKAFVLGGDGFVGIFDSVRVWSRALAIAEAKALPIAENSSALLSHWRMAEGGGNHLYDDVSENHGVATGGRWVDSPRSDQTGQFQFYIDGTPQPHEPASIVSRLQVAQLSIGATRNHRGFANHFAGTLEEIRIWNVPRTNEQITDNAFERLKGEWDQLLANYTFDKPFKQTENKVQDSGMNSIALTIHNPNQLSEVLSTAPVATEIPQVRSALTGVQTAHNGAILSRPAIVEYGDVQLNDDGTLNGILKRCYSFIDEDGVWHRMTGYKVGNLVSQWYSQAQFDPQVMGYIEGTPPVPAENFPVSRLGDVDIYAYIANNSVTFNQAEEVSYNYSTSRETGWNMAVEAEGNTGVDVSALIAPLGFGISFELKATVAATTNWDVSKSRSHSLERGTTVNTTQSFGAALAGYDNQKEGSERYYKLGNTGYALVKSKTADVYLLRLAHNNALVSIFWQPNPDIPEDVNIIPFPLNPLYTKQGTLDGKFGDIPDAHYPQAQGAYGQYSYFKPREAYRLKKKIERERLELKAYFEDSFDETRTNTAFKVAAAATGLMQLGTLVPVAGMLVTSALNQIGGQIATTAAYEATKLKDDLAKMGSQRNLVNTYVWTIEGGFFSESTEVAETQQEVFAGEASLSLGGGIGVQMGAEEGVSFEQKTLFNSGSSFTLTKSRTEASSKSFGLDVSVDLPTSPRYKYAGVDGRSLQDLGITPGTVDAYRFMSFYLEPHGENFTDLFTKVIDPIWLAQNPAPYAQALRQAQGNIDRAKPCWRVMHRVTYVSRILPEFTPEAPPSLERSMRLSGIESNYMLVKLFEPYLRDISDRGDFSQKVEQIIATRLPEFNPYKKQITRYLQLYFDIE